MLTQSPNNASLPDQPQSLGWRDRVILEHLHSSARESSGSTHAFLKGISRHVLLRAGSSSPRTRTKLVSRWGLCAEQPEGMDWLLFRNIHLLIIFLVSGMWGLGRKGSLTPCLLRPLDVLHGISSIWKPCLQRQLLPLVISGLAKLEGLNAIEKQGKNLAELALKSQRHPLIQIKG